MNEEINNMNIFNYIGKNISERGEKLMSKNNSKEFNKQNVNIGTKRTEDVKHQEKNTKNKRDGH